MSEDNRQFIKHGFFRIKNGDWVSLDLISCFNIKGRGDYYSILAFMKDSKECEAYIVMEYESKAEAQEDLDSIMGL